MSRQEIPEKLIVLSLTVGIVIMGWAALLSPPFAFIRNLLNIQLPPYGRLVIMGGQKAVEICNPNPLACHAYLSRLVFLYHSVFAIILAMVVYAATVLFSFNPEYKKPTLALTTIGYLMTLIGGLLYGYWIKDLTLHGIFIAGLALLFAVGILFVLGLRKSCKIDLLSLNILLSALLLLVTSLIGGWLGANQPIIGDSLVKAVMLSRFDPDLAEPSLPWRAMTAHQHGMVAILGASITFMLFKHFKINTQNRIIKMSLVLAAAGQLIMAVAVWAVVQYGRPAHLAITPASVVLLLATCLVIFADLKEKIKMNGIKLCLTKELRRVTSYLLVLGIWPAVAIPGAIVAISLRNPVILRPEFRNPIWDWAENAYSIGHWHILIFIYGTALFILFMDLFGSSKISNVATLLMGVSSLVAGIATNFYMIQFSTAGYVPNPYNDFVLSYYVEPALGIFTISVALSYVCVLYQFRQNTMHRRTR